MKHGKEQTKIIRGRNTLCFNTLLKTDDRKKEGMLKNREI